HKYRGFNLGLRVGLPHPPTVSLCGSVTSGNLNVMFDPDQSSFNVRRPHSEQHTGGRLKISPANGKCWDAEAHALRLTYRDLLRLRALAFALFMRRNKELNKVFILREHACHLPRW